ncbi:MAG: hypothetical protein AAFW46_14445 [Pseudomonadota bacterium]
MIWGAVHILAAVLIIPTSPSDGFANIADAVDRAALVSDYHPAVEAVLNQHGWNLGWGGAVALIGGVLIWRANRTAIWVTALVGGLLDVGYFVFIDLGGFANFIPGGLMTVVSGSAILLSGWVWLTSREQT